MASTVTSPPPAQPGRTPRGAGFSLRPFELLARASLLLATLGGFSIGLLLLLPVAFRLPVDLPWLPLAQVHGQLQVLGFAALFIFAVGTVLFPRFLGVLEWRHRWATFGGLLLAAGVVLRAVSQPIEPSAVRSAGLLLSGVLVLAGPLLFVSAVVQAARVSVQPFGLWRLGLIFGFGMLLAGLLLNLWAVWRLAIGGLETVPVPLDEAIIQLEVQGFVVSVALGVSTRVFTQFLLLRPARGGAFAWLLPGYALGVILTALGWLALELHPDARPTIVAFRTTGNLLAFLSLVGFVLALRLYEPPARDSGQPVVTNPTRTWFRLAYGWLLLSALLALLLSGRETFGGAPPGFTELSAARHALTMGFLTVLLVGMAARILPGYSGWALQRPAFLWRMIGLLLLGSLLRVGGEMTGGYGGLFGPLVGVGGVLATLGFLLFAASLWPALGHLPDA